MGGPITPLPHRGSVDVAAWFRNARNWRRKAEGVKPSSCRNTTESCRWSENPACRDTSDIDILESASRDFARSRWTRRISSQTPRPRAARRRRQGTTRDGDFAEHVFNLNWLVGVTSDKAERGGDISIVDGEHVGRAADHDSLRRQQ